jgi:hypothetical protein
MTKGSSFRDGGRVHGYASGGIAGYAPGGTVEVLNGMSNEDLSRLADGGDKAAYHELKHRLSTGAGQATPAGGSLQTAERGADMPDLEIPTWVPPWPEGGIASAGQGIDYGDAAAATPDAIDMAPDQAGYWNDVGGGGGIADAIAPPMHSRQYDDRGISGFAPQDNQGGNRWQPNLPIAAAGFRMAASRNPSFLGALAEGASAGLDEYGRQVDARRQAAIDAEKSWYYRTRADAARQEEDRKSAEQTTKQKAFDDFIASQPPEKRPALRAAAASGALDSIIGDQFKPSKPQSQLAQLKADLDAGMITPAQYQAAVRKETYIAPTGGADSGAWEVIDLPGVGKVQRNKRTGKVEGLPGSGSDLSQAQLANNAEIDAAREYLLGGDLTLDEIVRRTQESTATGRENPDFDPYLAQTYRLAMQRKVGEDPEFATMQKRFRGGSRSSAGTGGGKASAEPTGSEMPIGEMSIEDLTSLDLSQLSADDKAEVDRRLTELGY